jgi:hypothetical protein
MCVVGGGNSRNDAIHVKGMIACTYRMLISGSFGDRCGKHGPSRPYCVHGTLQVRNEHKVFDECPDDGLQERQNPIHLDPGNTFCVVM